MANILVGGLAGMVLSTGFDFYTENPNIYLSLGVCTGLGMLAGYGLDKLNYINNKIGMVLKNQLVYQKKPNYNIQKIITIR